MAYGNGTNMFEFFFLFARCVCVSVAWDAQNIAFRILQSHVKYTPLSKPTISQFEFQIFQCKCYLHSQFGRICECSETELVY